MEFGLEKTEIQYYRRSSCGGTTFTAETETVVPDVMPDIGEIICASGIPLLRKKEVSEGSLTISGSIQAQVLYQPDAEQSLKKLEVEFPFSLIQDAPEADEALFTVFLQLACLDACARNPRKLSLQAELCAELCRYDVASLRIGNGLLSEESRGICLRKEAVSAEFISGVYEKSFILTDTFPLTGAKGPACELLGQRVTLNDEDVKFVGTKLIMKGVLYTELIWRTEDEELFTSVFSSGFSQILEIGELNDPIVEVSFTLTGAYFDLLYSANDSRNVTAELHVLAQVTCSQQKEVCYISDVYSNLLQIRAQFGAPMAFFTCERETCNDNMRGLIETPYSVREILQTTADAGLWANTESGFACPINVQLLLRDEEGALHGIVRSFMAKWDVPMERDDYGFLRNVSCKELTAVPTADGVEIRLLAAAQLNRCKTTRITALEALDADEDSRIDLSACPSITVLPYKSSDFWTLAKKYHSTVSLIENANLDLNSDILLIPRAR